MARDKKGVNENAYFFRRSLVQRKLRLLKYFRLLLQKIKSMSQNTPTFYLGLTMAGAVSAGCYTAGVLDYLFEILDLWERAKKGEVEGINEKLVPQYNVVIDAMGGTSAGGMATLMAAIYALEGNIQPVKEKPDNPLDSQNLLYDSWVHLADDLKGGQKSFEKIWDTGDLEGEDAKVQSLFNSEFLEIIADKVLTVQEKRSLTDQVNNLPSYISKDLDILLSHTLLRGIPLEVQFQTKIGKGRADAPTHTSYEHWLLSHFKLNQGKEVHQKDGHLWLNPYSKEHRERLKLSTISTGAFPIGLKFRDFDQKQYTNDYYKAIAKKLIYDEFGVGATTASQELSFSLPDNFESITIDGGAMNNEPYREVASILRKHGPTDGFQNYGLIMIDPFPDMYEPSMDKYLDNKPEDLVDVVPSIIKTLWDQAKIKRREMKEQFARDHIHSQIYPKRNLKSEDNQPDTDSYPIASGSFAAFGGFLDVKFRIHDFFLGRNNARNFVRYFFSLPIDEKNQANNHPIHRNWTEESLEKYKIKKRDKATGEYQFYLPIIPDLNIVLNKLPWAGAEWNDYTIAEKPKYNPTELFALEDQIRNRYEKLISVLIKKMEKGAEEEGNKSPITNAWLAEKNRKGLLARLGSAIKSVTIAPVGRGAFNLIQSKAIRKMVDKMTEGTIRMILKDLEDKGLLEKPK